MMIKSFCSVLSVGCLLSATVFMAPHALAQKSEPLPQEALGSVTPKDIHTRAKMHTELGSLYFENDNYIVALEEFTLAISINPNYAQAYSTRGLVLYYVQELESAEKDFKRALDLDEKDPEINNNFGWFLCQTKREKDAISYFQRAIKNPLYQTPGMAYLNAGSCYIKMGDLDLAEDSVRKALRFMPGNSQALYYLANISYKRGNYDAAKKHLTEIVRQSDPGPEVLWLSLRVEKHLGNRSDENSMIAQLRRKFPDSPEYQEFLKGNFE